MMTTRTDKTHPSGKPNEDKFNFSEHCRDLDSADAFSQPDRTGVGLRDFVKREIQRETLTYSGGGSTEVLIRGRAFLRVMPSGEFELSIFRGRNTFDTFYSWDRDELVRYAESLQGGK
jgi:hypothetical protein